MPYYLYEGSSLILLSNKFAIVGSKPALHELRLHVVEGYPSECKSGLILFSADNGLMDLYVVISGAVPFSPIVLTFLFSTIGGGQNHVFSAIAFVSAVVFIFFARFNLSSIRAFSSTMLVINRTISS